MSVDSSTSPDGSAKGDDVPLAYATRFTDKLNGGALPVATGLLILALGLIEVVCCGIIAASSIGGNSRSSEEFLFVAVLLAIPGALCVLAGLFIVFRALRRFDW